MLVADLRRDLVQTHLAAYRDLSAEAARAIYAPLLAEAMRLLTKDAVDRRYIEIRVDMRYIGQSFELPIPLLGEDESAWGGLVPAFPAEPRHRFRHDDT